MLHVDKDPVPDTLRRLRDDLESAGLPYVVIGATAMVAHGYQRATEDVDICMLADDLERFKTTFVGSKYQTVAGRSRRFLDPESIVTVDILISGEFAGRVSRNNTIRFPAPADAVELMGMPTVSLATLIELKLVTWRFKDWADVVELMRRNKLGEDFAEKLDPLVRMAYLECYDQMRDEDAHAREA